MKRRGNKIVDEKRYSLWKTDLELVLQKRFGIGINDCLDESDMNRCFNAGESTVEVACWLKDKRELNEL